MCGIFHNKDRVILFVHVSQKMRIGGPSLRNNSLLEYLDHTYGAGGQQGDPTDST